MAISKISVGVALGLVVAFGVASGAAAQQDNRPANDAPRPLARDQGNTPDIAKKREADAQAGRADRSRDPDRPTIGPRTTQGLAQDAISRSNSR